MNNWEAPSTGPVVELPANGWEDAFNLANFEPTTKITPTPRNNAPATVKVHPVIPPPTHEESTAFSPMSSLNAKPDDGWASWGSDPSAIKKEDEQVKRPPPTFVKIEEVVKSLPKGTSSGSRVSGSRNSVTHSKTKVNNKSSGSTALADGRDQHRSKAVSPRSPRSNYPTPLLGPGVLHRQFLPPQIPIRMPQNSSNNMRPPPPPTYYTTRPTFKYGQVQSQTIQHSNSELPPKPRVDMPVLERIEQASGSSSFDRPRSSKHLGERKVYAEPSSIVTPSKSIMTGQDTLSVRSNIRSAAVSGQEVPQAIPNDAHSISSLTRHTSSSNPVQLTLPYAAGDDSGHGSSPPTPSTMQFSSAAVQSPKVHLPNLEDLRNFLPSSQHHEKRLPSSDLSLSSSIPIMSTSSTNEFSLKIPTNMSVPKAMIVIDYNNLLTLCGDQIELGLNVLNRKIDFRIANDTSVVRKHCMLVVNIAISALQEACAPFPYQVEDQTTRELLYGEPASSHARFTSAAMLDNAPCLNDIKSPLISTPTFAPSSCSNAPTATSYVGIIQHQNDVSATAVSLLPTQHYSNRYRPEELPNETAEVSIRSQPASNPASAVQGVPSHPWVKRNGSDPNVYEICLPLPDDLVMRTGKYCRLETQIPLKQCLWIRRSGHYILRDGNIDNLEFARRVLLVVLQLVEPNFSPAESVLRLEHGSPEMLLVGELLADESSRLRNAATHQLTRHVIERLRDSTSQKASVTPSATLPLAQNPSPFQAHSRNISIDSVQQAEVRTSHTDKLDVTPSTLSPLAQVYTAKTSEIQEFAPIPAASEDYVRENAPFDLVQKTVDTKTVGQADNRNTDGLITEDNALCWYLPEGASRGRFFGTGGNYMKTIWKSSGITKLFWKVNSPDDRALFLFLIGSRNAIMTPEERSQLAFAFRLCKGWAIAIFAPDMLPLEEDLPETFRSDELFRLNEEELEAAFTMSVNLRNFPPDEYRRTAALCELVEVFKRSPHSLHDPHAPPRPLPVKALWPGMFSELCSQHNSICWTANGILQATQFSGHGFMNLKHIEAISGVPAVIFDTNERRYGQDNCRIYILGSKNHILVKEQEQSLVLAYRLLVAALRIFGYPTLLPAESTFKSQTLAAKAFRMAQSDTETVEKARSLVQPAGMTLVAIQALASMLQSHRDFNLFDSSAGIPASLVSDTHSVPSPPDETSVCDGYVSIRDIPGFSLSGEIHDGFMTENEERCEGETEKDWERLDRAQTMYLIGSLCWTAHAVQEALDDVRQSMYDSYDVGPSASQVAGSDTASLPDCEVQRDLQLDSSGWYAAHAEEEAKAHIQPRTGEWVKELPLAQSENQESQSPPLAIDELPLSLEKGVSDEQPISQSLLVR